MMATHVAAGAATASLAATLGVLPVDAPLAAIAAAASLVPDIDHASSTLGRRLGPISWLLSKLAGHRTWTHSLWALGGWAWFWFSCAPFEFAATVTLGYASHIAVDALTPKGVPLFNLRKRHSLRLARTGGVGEIPFLTVFSAVAVAPWLLLA